jgi:FkbM family methyltransferase
MRLLGIADKIYLKKLKGGFKMYVTPEEHIQQQLFWYGHYEKSLATALKNLLKPDSIFIDIGANTGYFTLLVERLTPQGSVIAFEPVSYLFEALQKNIEVNNAIQIRAVNAAIGERNEERKIYLSGSDNTGMSSFQKPGNYSGKDEWVKVFSLDSWFQQSGLPAVDVVKIDVEGNELAVLKGMKEIIKNNRPHILIEINPETLSYFRLTPADLLNYITELSCHCFVITETGKLNPVNKLPISEAVNAAVIHSSRLNEVNSYLA